MTHTKNIFYFDVSDENSYLKLARTLSTFVDNYFYNANDIVVLCIGSDRVTGDSLGPLVGYKLEKNFISRTRLLKKHHFRKLHLYGTLDSPVHAINLSDKIEEIKKAHPFAPIIAIDASLGNAKYLGYVTVGVGPLHPGTGVHKELPSVGDFFITGIVGVSGILEHLTLQTTRLSTVMKLADTISQSIAILLSQNQKQLQ